MKLLILCDTEAAFISPEVHPHSVGAQEGVVHSSQQLLVVPLVCQQDRARQTHTHIMQSESTRGSCGAGTDQRASSRSPRRCGGRAGGAADGWPRPRWPAHSLTSSSCGARSAGQNKRQSRCWEINVQTSRQKIQELEQDQNKCGTSSGA